MAAAECQDGVRAANGPEHAGLLAAGADDRFAACFDDAGAYKEVLGAKHRISHAFLVVVEVVGFGADLFEEFRIERVDCAERSDEFFDLAFVQQFILVDSHPPLLFGLLAWI